MEDNPYQPPKTTFATAQSKRSDLPRWALWFGVVCWALATATLAVKYAFVYLLHHHPDVAMKFLKFLKFLFDK